MWEVLLCADKGCSGSGALVEHQQHQAAEVSRDWRNDRALIARVLLSPLSAPHANASTCLFIQYLLHRLLLLSTADDHRPDLT
jgi:hypothetical protein